MKKKIAKNKLNSLTQTDGEIISEPLPKRQPRTMDEVWAGQTKFKYNHTTIEGYKNWLMGLNLIDIMDHSVSMGFPAVNDRSRLINRLLQEFQDYNNKYVGTGPVVVKNKPIDPMVAKILAQAK